MPIQRSRTKRSLSNDQVRTFIAESLGCAMHRSQELTDGFFNAAFLVTLASGERVVLKVAPPAGVPVLRQERGLMHTEAAVMRQVAEHTCIPVPRLRHYAPYNPHTESALLIMAYLDGVPFDRLQPQLTLAEQQSIYRELGRYLRALHALQQPQFGYPHVGDVYDRWSATYLALLDNVLQDAQDQQIPLALPGDVLYHLAASFCDVLDEVRLASLLHRDLWFGNLFLDPGNHQIIGITDWERSLYGDPLLDFVFGFVAGGYPFPAAAAFYEGYGREARLTRAEQIRVDLYALYAALLIVVEGQYRGYQTPEEAQQAQAALRRRAASLQRHASN